MQPSFMVKSGLSTSELIFPSNINRGSFTPFSCDFLLHTILSAVENRWPGCKLRSELLCVYSWFLPSDKYTDKHVVAILINHTLGALPTVFLRTGCKMQHSKEIPHIAASDPLPKPGLRKTVISLLESHVITLPATFLNAPQLFFFFFTGFPQTQHIKPGWLTASFYVKQFSEKAVLESFDAVFAIALEASRQSPSQLSSCYQR